MPIAETWFVDSEYGYAKGRVGLESAYHAVLFCAIGRHSQEWRHFWGHEIDKLKQWFNDHNDDLFVTHNITAEMKYLLRAGVPLPPHWFDTYVGYRYVSNSLIRPDADLVSALTALGLPHQDPVKKGQLQKRILYQSFTDADMTIILEYCYGDCGDCGTLYDYIAGRVAPTFMRNTVRYLRAVSRMELRGIPVDIRSAELILNHREEIREALISRVNEITGARIYRGGVFNRRAFLHWAASNGIAWPWRVSSHTGKYIQSLDNDAFKMMEGRHPFLPLIRQVKKTLKVLERIAIVLDGTTHRHYFSTHPFGSLTGRNQPKNFVFSGPKWLRFLIIRETPDRVLFYLDAVSQEFGVAGALSGDPTMRSMYEQADPHMAFAILAGLAPPGATKATHAAARKIGKGISLGQLYGQSEYGLSDRVGVTLGEARHLLERHHDIFPDYWSWSRGVVSDAMVRGVIRTRCGWPCNVRHEDFNIIGSNGRPRSWRTLTNFPIQATSADLMRFLITYLDQQGIRLLAPVHDGFLMSCGRDQIGDFSEAVRVAVNAACDDVLGYRLRWELTPFESRYYDADGEPVWDLIQRALTGIS